MMCVYIYILIIHDIMIIQHENMHGPDLLSLV